MEYYNTRSQKIKRKIEFTTAQTCHTDTVSAASTIKGLIHTKLVMELNGKYYQPLFILEELKTFNKKTALKK